MKRVRLVAASVPRQEDNLVILAEKNRLDTLESHLFPAESVFLRQHAERDIANFFFPRAEGAVFVRLFKEEKDADAETEQIRVAGSSLLTELRQYKIGQVTVLNLCPRPHLLAFAEGLALGSYQFLRHFSQPEKKETPLDEIRLLNADESAVAELNILIEAVFLTRDLVNEPFSHLDAPAMAAAAVSAGSTYGFEVEVLGKEKLESLKMGGLLSVNQASNIPPQFCIMEYRPQGARNEKPIILVGKGVVYDTGGLSLKPSEGMDYMKCDMAGGAAVIGTMSAVAANQLPIHVIGLVPMTDNKVSAAGYAPGDVITMYSGTTVEVLNTDAEGRLILADALHYAKKYDPELVIDFATLTGAAVKAVGSYGTCYMGTASKEIKQSLAASGEATYERLVEFPLWKEYGEELKSHIADLKNIVGGNAGMTTAGKFLEHFTSYPWLHLDIAGPAYLRTANAYRTKEGTGVGVRLMYDFLKKWGK